MEDEPRFSLGSAIEQLYEGSLADWRSDYAPSTSVSDLLAGPLERVEVKADVLPRGRVDVTIYFFARRRFDNEVYFAKLLRDGAGYRAL